MGHGAATVDRDPAGHRHAGAALRTLGAVGLRRPAVGRGSGRAFGAPSDACSSAPSLPAVEFFVLAADGQAQRTGLARQHQLPRHAVPPVPPAPRYAADAGPFPGPSGSYYRCPRRSARRGQYPTPGNTSCASGVDSPSRSSRTKSITSTYRRAGRSRRRRPLRPQRSPSPARPDGWSGPADRRVLGSAERMLPAGTATQTRFCRATPGPVVLPVRSATARRSGRPCRSPPAPGDRDWPPQHRLAFELFQRSVHRRRSRRHGWSMRVRWRAADGYAEVSEQHRTEQQQAARAISTLLFMGRPPAMRPDRSMNGKSPAIADDRKRKRASRCPWSWPYSGTGFPWQVHWGYRLATVVIQEPKFITSNLRR